MKKLVFAFAVLAAMSISSCCGVSTQEAASNDTTATLVDSTCCETVDTLVVDTVQ